MGDAALSGDIAQNAFGPGVADHHLGPGVGQEVFHFRLSVGGGQGHVDGAGTQDGEVQKDRLGGLLHLPRHPVALLDPQAAQ